ncbi:DUF4422 domain-containing protein [Lactiplantibacillus xiangfangensis]|nr:DUF4422 domain-containing protein [Lactiplantibacillus xiangfangensis]
MRVKILVAAHKKFPMPENRNIYLPILVGAKKNYKPGIDFQRDDIGVNISAKNPNYNELTAIYWAWKNLKDVEAVGLVHYRRVLSTHRKGGFPSVLNQEEIDSLLLNHDAIVPRKRHYYIETNYSHYIHAHHKEPLDQTREIIKTSCPEYLDAFDKVMSRRSAHMFNMFVMKKNVFDDYCEWLFQILTQVEQSIDISEYTTQEARVFGYISELLFDVWLLENNIQYTECYWQQIGKKQTGKKIFYFVCRKFGLNFGKTHF